MNPTEIIVIVYGAKNLKGRKTKHHHKYSVIFGVDNSKFRTTVVQSNDGNPEWLEESTVPIHNHSAPLTFVVTDKDEVQGQISVSTDKLPTEEYRRKMKSFLEPHKKCPNPQGELIYEAWFPHQDTQSVPAITVTSTKEHNEDHHKGSKIKQLIAKSPIMRRKNHSPKSSPCSTPLDSPDLSLQTKDNNNRLSGSSLSNFLSKSPVLRRKNNRLNELNNSAENQRRMNTSLQDLSSIEKIENDLNRQKRPETTCGMLTISTKGTWKSKSSTDLILEQRPDIRSVTPDVVSCEGDVVLSICGVNLGTCKEDIVGLFVCGANLLKTVEYVSSEEIRCTTKPWKVCSGHVVMETQSGGKVKSLCQVKVIKQVNEMHEHSNVNGDGTEKNCDGQKIHGKHEQKKTGILSMFAKENEKDLIEKELHKVKLENEELRAENATMRLYIDHLVARVMEECPEALQS